MSRQQVFRRGLVAAALPGALFACSLTGVADFEPGQCETDAQCRELFNPDLGFDVACATYRCVDSGTRSDCVRIEGEVCDGEDNDCDLVIDEPEEGTAVLETTSELLAGAMTDVATASWVTSSSFGERIYVAADAPAPPSTDWVVSLSEDGATEPLVMWRMVSPGDDQYNKTELTSIQPGCYAAAGGASTDCDARELAVAVGDEHAFFAQVDTLGCSAGELRVGVIDGAAPSGLLDRGRGAWDPTYRGVATHGTVCTDSGTPECAAAKGATSPDEATIRQACGASRPALAALNEQALTVFLGQSRETVNCGADPVPVLALGIHLDSVQHSATFIWSNPTGDGEPQVLGSTSGGAAPGVAALPDLGFLVAFATEEDQVRLSFVPEQQAPPSAAAGLECTDELSCDDRSGLETQPLLGISELRTWPDAPEADGVRLAVLPLDEETFAVGLSWLEGCARVDQDFGARAAFARVVQVSTAGDDGPTVTFEGEVLALGDTSRIPLLVPTNGPFFVPGFERADRTVGTDDRGGFLALTYDGRARARRLAAFDGQLVDEDETVPFGPAGDLYLAAGPDGQVVSYRPADSELRRAALVCAEN